MEHLNPNYNLLIAKKTEKIVTAIYLITQFLKDKESLKNDLRGESNKLLKSLNSLAYIESKDVFSIYRKSLDIVSLLISYLTIAKDTNLISKMNSEIVIEALRVLENLLAKKQFYLSKENLFINEENLLANFLSEKEIFTPNTNTSFDALTERNAALNNLQNNNYIQTMVGNSMNIASNKNLEKNKEKEIDRVEKERKENGLESYIKDKIISKGHFIKDIENIENLKDKSIKSIKDTLDIKKTNSLKNKEKSEIPKKQSRNKDRKKVRQDQIIALFTKGVEVSINDISKKIIGCSPKTLQRELNELVAIGKIEKIGDKRWSKYILAN